MATFHYTQYYLDDDLTFNFDVTASPSVARDTVGDAEGTYKISYFDESLLDLFDTPANMDNVIPPTRSSDYMTVTEQRYSLIDAKKGDSSTSMIRIDLRPYVAQIRPHLYTYVNIKVNGTFYGKTVSHDLYIQLFLGYRFPHKASEFIGLPNIQTHGEIGTTGVVLEGLNNDTGECTLIPRYPIDCNIPFNFQSYTTVLMGMRGGANGYQSLNFRSVLAYKVDGGYMHLPTMDEEVGNYGQYLVYPKFARNSSNLTTMYTDSPSGGLEYINHSNSYSPIISLDEWELNDFETKKLLYNDLRYAAGNYTEWRFPNAKASAMYIRMNFPAGINTQATDRMTEVWNYLFKPYSGSTMTNNCLAASWFDLWDKLYETAQDKYNETLDPTYQADMIALTRFRRSQKIKLSSVNASSMTTDVKQTVAAFESNYFSWSGTYNSAPWSPWLQLLHYIGYRSVVSAMVGGVISLDFMASASMSTLVPDNELYLGLSIDLLKEMRTFLTDSTFKPGQWTANAPTREPVKHIRATVTEVDTRTQVKNPRIMLLTAPFNDSYADFYGQPYQETILAKLDQCPAKYYVKWRDRLGGIQCQPFGKGSYVNSRSTYNYLNRYNGTQTPYNIDTTIGWHLVSDWMTKDQRIIFESLTCSPEITLYDTELDRSYNVLVQTFSFDEGTKRLQNMTVDFILNTKQKTKL